MICGRTGLGPCREMDRAHPVFMNPFCCVFIGQSAPLWISNHPSYVCGGAESLLGCQINYLKITRAVICNMKWHAKNKRGSEKKTAFQATDPFLNIVCLIPGPMWLH